MYLSEVKIVNWRSYRDVQFRFPEPTSKKPLALIGAMNGHGKTSLLYALYFGLFGRYATSFAAEFLDPKDEGWRGYRQAMSQLRRRGSDSSDPTEIEITLTPTKQDPDGMPVIRVCRSWFFSARGDLRDRGEEARLYLDDHLVEHIDPREPDQLHRELEELLFPPHVLPAFFFDGEQALRRVEAANDRQMKDAVEVLFGTRLLNDVCGKLDGYVEERRSELRRAAQGADSVRLEQLSAERDRLVKEISDAKGTLALHAAAKEAADNRFETAKTQLFNLGLANASEISRYAQLVERSKLAREQAQTDLKSVAREMALPMALGRAEAIRTRLSREKVLEEWEAVRAGTRSRTPVVLERAFPTPDPLLDFLPSDKLLLLKQRVKGAIDAIYEPPPDGCAGEVVFGHIRGDVRGQVLRDLDGALTLGADRVKQAARAFRNAREVEDEARRKWEQFRDVSELAVRLQQEMDAALTDSKASFKAMSDVEGKLPGLAADLSNRQSEIARVEKAIYAATPIQRRIQIAESSRDALREFSTRLRPIALDRISVAVGQHFRAMADPRFKKAEVLFRDDGTAVLHDGGQEWLVAKMAGFEKRAFGIAFTLALAEVTGIRAPLVIDTPIGNADSRYRLRVLKHLADAKVDQVVILTHDEEVNGTYYESIKAKVSKHFIVEFREVPNGSGYSLVQPDRFFSNRDANGGR